MILDGDLAVAPEELPKFYEALTCGKGEFVNGTRMIYPHAQSGNAPVESFSVIRFSVCCSHIFLMNVLRIPFVGPRFFGEGTI